MEPLSPAQKLILSLVALAVVALSLPTGYLLIEDLRGETQASVTVMLLFLGGISFAAAIVVHRVVRLKR